MNHDPTSTWSPMVSGPEEDFANFLEFGDLQLNFPNFDTAESQNVDTSGGAEQEHLGAGGGGVVDTNMEHEAGGMMQLKERDLNSALDPRLMDMQTTMPELVHGPSTESLMELEMQAQLFHQQQYNQQQQQHRMAHTQYRRQQGIVPPTPNSIEMHGGHAQHFAQMDGRTRAMYEHYSKKQQDNMMFTPLVSPAVTPVDAQFRIPEYTIPGEYFSPLTSPALEAQHHATQRSVYGALRGSDTSDTTSPIDMNMDSNTSVTSASGPAPGKKSRRKTTSTSTKNPARAVRQSPAMKPQSRKKQPSSTVIPPKEIHEIIQDAQKSKSNGSHRSSKEKLSLPYSQDSSEGGSISPEPLSEILMPPPATPRPGSVGKSPHLSAQHKGPQSTASNTNAPATPASLMRIQKPSAPSDAHLAETTSAAEAQMEQIMSTIPAPTSRKPSLPNINTAVANDSEATPTLSARRGPPTSSAPTTATGSVFPSPGLSALASPKSGIIAGKRGEAKTTTATGRGSKKRNSTASSQASPALRPRISPSIKPLLPEGTPLTSQTSALLLASKSNYQNILEGTHLPGVSYPEALSTNLTSKRTSHKIAEQGRRNRINNALQEIAALLPPTTPTMNGTGAAGGAGAGAGNVAANSNSTGASSVGDREESAGARGGGGGGTMNVMMTGTAAQQSNSKASTVESAIEYIKALQAELRDVKGRLEVAEGKLMGEKMESTTTTTTATTTISPEKTE